MSVVRLLKPFVLFVLATLVMLSMMRSGLLLWQFDRVVETQGFGYILLQGVRFDLVLLGVLLVIPLTLSPLISFVTPIRPVWNWLLRIYLSLCFIAILFIELSTPSFIAQYDLRPNYLWVEYLKYPKEVFSTLWTAYKLPLIFSIVVTVVSAFFFDKKLNASQQEQGRVPWPAAILLPPVLFVLCVMMGRSTLDHRAVNPSTVAFSSDPLVNTLPLSSAYSVLYAIYETRHEDSNVFPYGEMDKAKVFDIVKNTMTVEESQFVSEELPTLHKQTASIQHQQPMNLVIILEESLGAEYVGALGGRQITPNLDALSKQGIWFDNLYATGTRSVRGIEAMITGFTPTPSRSVVKLSKSQTDFFTVAELLEQYDYDTSFIYGGESHFDNMRRFFANNGFNKIIDENDYENPIFYGSWGASDEDLFNKAHETFSAYKKDQPFFSLVFTSSNHSPFDFPDGRIEIVGDEKQTVDNAVKYADYALGEYIEKARNSNYWDNTLFIIVADHSDKVYGNDLVPVKHFRIPALILGKNIAPKTYSQVASQIDLMPTALSLMGINNEHPAIGKDLSYNIINDVIEPGRAIMQLSGTQAYMEDDQVVVLQKNKAPLSFVYKDERLKKTKEDNQALVEKAKAHANWSLIAYRDKLYRLPEQKTLTALETHQDITAVK